MVTCKKRILCALFCAVMITVSCGSSVNAAGNCLNCIEPEEVTDVTNASESIQTIAAGSATYYIGGSNYTLIASNNSGIGRAISVHIINFNSAQYRADIIMNGRNGMIWSENDCIGASGMRQFSCGNDVTHVYLRIVPRSGAVQTFRVEVIVGV